MTSFLQTLPKHVTIFPFSDAPPALRLLSRIGDEEYVIAGPDAALVRSIASQLAFDYEFYPEAFRGMHVAITSRA